MAHLENGVEAAQVEERSSPIVEPLLLDLAAAAALLSLPPSTLRSWAWEGRVPHVKLGRRRMFSKEALERWIEQNTCPVRSRHVDTIARRAYRIGVGSSSEGKEGG